MRKKRFENGIFVGNKNSKQIREKNCCQMHSDERVVKNPILSFFFSFVIVVALSFLGAPSLLRSKQTPILISCSKINNSKLKKWAKSVYFVTGKVSTDLSDQLSTFFLDISTKIRLWAKNSSKVNKVWRFLRQIAILKLLVEEFVKLKGLRGKTRILAFTLAKFDDFSVKLQFWSLESKNSWKCSKFEKNSLFFA